MPLADRLEQLGDEPVHCRLHAGRKRRLGRAEHVEPLQRESRRVGQLHGRLEAEQRGERQRRSGCRRCRHVHAATLRLHRRLLVQAPRLVVLRVVRDGAEAHVACWAIPRRRRRPLPRCTARHHGGEQRALERAQEGAFHRGRILRRQHRRRTHVLLQPRRKRMLPRVAGLLHRAPLPGALLRQVLVQLGAPDADRDHLAHLTGFQPGRLGQRVGERQGALERARKRLQIHLDRHAPRVLQERRHIVRQHLAQKLLEERRRHALRGREQASEHSKLGPRRLLQEGEECAERLQVQGAALPDVVCGVVRHALQEDGAACQVGVGNHAAAVGQQLCVQRALLHLVRRHTHRIKEVRSPAHIPRTRGKAAHIILEALLFAGRRRAGRTHFDQAGLLGGERRTEQHIDVAKHTAHFAAHTLCRVPRAALCTAADARRDEPHHIAYQRALVQQGGHLGVRKQQRRRDTRRVQHRLDKGEKRRVGGADSRKVWAGSARRMAS